MMRFFRKNRSAATGVFLIFLATFAFPAATFADTGTGGNAETCDYKTGKCTYQTQVCDSKGQNCSNQTTQLIGSGVAAAATGVGTCSLGLPLLPSISWVLSQLGLAQTQAGEAQAQTGGILADTGEAFSKIGDAIAKAATALFSGFPVTDKSVNTGNVGTAVAGTGGTMATVGVANTGAGVATGVSGVGKTTAATANATNVIASIKLDESKQGFLSCVARAIARAMIQQVTVSTVNWINSGFNGSPSFVQNPTSFFGNVADQAAGNFLQSSDLAFLCSPFNLQVKIAIAQAYGGYNSNQCSITKLVSNYGNFMNNFNSGGWAAFISLTGNPNNHAFGAYLTGLDGMQAAIARAQNQKQTQLSQSGGFLDFQQKSNCQFVSNTDAVKSGSCSDAGSCKSTNPNLDISIAYDTSGNWIGYTKCDIKTVTPGSAISSSLSKVLGTNLDSLNLAKSFDEIISALVSQLIQRVLYGGLSNLGGSTGNYGNTFTGGVNASSALQGSISSNISTVTAAAQQVISIDQQNISDINGAIAGASSALNCWQSLASSTDASSTTATVASSAMATTKSDTLTLNSYFGQYQNQMNGAQGSLSAASNFQNQAFGTSDLTTLENLAAQFSSAVGSGGVSGQTDVNVAQEDQLILQSNLGNINTKERASLQLCQAGGQYQPPPAP